MLRTQWLGSALAVQGSPKTQLVHGVAGTLILKICALGGRRRRVVDNLLIAATGLFCSSRVRDMAKLMRTLGVGSRGSILALAVMMLMGGSACSTREAGAEGGAPGDERTRGERTRSGPEQVVQSMVGTGRNGPGVAREGSAASVEPSPVGEGEARASAAGVSRASRDSLPARGNAAETITSRHLEAELDRLEAELAN